MDAVKRCNDMSPNAPDFSGPREIIVLLGAPGAGKGTICDKLKPLFDIPQLSTGDMLRAAIAAQTPVGVKVQSEMAAGQLGGVELVVDLIGARIQEPDCSRGFILDGFPRTMRQAEALDVMLDSEGESVSHVLHLAVPDSILEDRICGRWTHRSSGRSYHLKSKPPKSYDGSSPPTPENMRDDLTDEPLYQRPDDTAEALKSRLETFHAMTAPLLDYYGKRGNVVEINGNQKPGEVLAAVEKAFGEVEAGDKKHVITKVV